LTKYAPAISSVTTPGCGGHSVVFIDCFVTTRKKLSASNTFPPISQARTGSVTALVNSVTQSWPWHPPQFLRIARVGSMKDYKPFDRATIPQRNAYAPTQPNRIVYFPAPASAPSK